MSSYHHRKSGGLSDELSQAQRLEISQRRLAAEVSAACGKWLRAQGIPAGRLFTHPADRTARHGDPDAKHGAPPA